MLTNRFGCCSCILRLMNHLLHSLHTIVNPLFGIFYLFDCVHETGADALNTDGQLFHLLVTSCDFVILIADDIIDFFHFHADALDHGIQLITACFNLLAGG